VSRSGPTRSPYRLRRRVDVPIDASATAAGEAEELEDAYAPGDLSPSPMPRARRRSPPTPRRAPTGARRARRALGASGRSSRSLPASGTCPGRVFDRVPARGPGLKTRLLVVAASLGGADASGASGARSSATRRGALAAAKPALGGQTAVVVGPRRGRRRRVRRVRVQFPDRRVASTREPCWMRVSQGWAGPGLRWWRCRA
jgi:hypothetical protein